MPLARAAESKQSYSDEGLRQARPPKVAGAMAPEFPQYGGGSDYTAHRGTFGNAMRFARTATA